MNLSLKDNSKSQLVPSRSQYEQWLSVHKPKFILCVCVCVCVCLLRRKETIQCWARERPVGMNPEGWSSLSLSPNNQ